MQLALEHPEDDIPSQRCFERLVDHLFSGLEKLCPWGSVGSLRWRIGSTFADVTSKMKPASDHILCARLYVVSKNVM